MKRYKKSFLFRYGYYLTLLVWMNILLFRSNQTYVFLFMILLTLIALILNSIYAYYIIKDNKFSLPMGDNLDIKKIKSIHKRKLLFFNKFYIDFKISQFRWISVYPHQSDIDIIIKDLVEINPNIIVKEYKFYNDNFEIQE